MYASTAAAKASYKRQKEKEREREKIRKWDAEYKSSKRRQQQTQLYGKEYTDRMTGTSRSREDEILEKIRAIWLAETIRRQIELDKEHIKSCGEVIKQMIVAATEKLKKTAWVKIYIDKYDYDMMMAADADVLEELSHLSDNIKFIVMDKEEDGSCIIEMPEEIVDISVNTQIENIRDILENIRI